MIGDEDAEEVGIGVGVGGVTGPKCSRTSAAIIVAACVNVPRNERCTAISSRRSMLERQVEGWIPPQVEHFVAREAGVRDSLGV